MRGRTKGQMSDYQKKKYLLGNLCLRLKMAKRYSAALPNLLTQCTCNGTTVFKCPLIQTLNIICNVKITVVLVLNHHARKACELVELNLRAFLPPTLDRNS
jgi:hypothetical protein